MNFYDVIIVGAGHAGCEAASVCARRGHKTLLITGNFDRIAHMSCNPAIGGLGKGHLVREIDALGGLMGKVADATGIQFRKLNTKKGAAVQGTRCQSDMFAYSKTMRQVLENTSGLEIKQAIVADILVSEGRIKGIQTQIGETFNTNALIITTGTFLKGLCHIGLKQIPGGRIPDFTSNELSDSLSSLGLELGRLKTGTVPRLDGRTIDYTHLVPQWGDNPRPHFSYSPIENNLEQLPCHITYTNEKTHDIIRANLDRSPLYTGVIQGTGPRYCPSIEDKIKRFADKNRHQIFLEPVGLNTFEIYPNGLSTSLPVDVQLSFLRSIPGLEKVEIIRPGYAVEYDYVPPTQIHPSFQTKAIRGLFLAGQINGTTGYEEAAAQGFLAGINASLALLDQEPFVLSRSQAYMGVMVDDLVTKGVGGEPYRMFTSRAEYRLFLREDSTDVRLSPLGHRLGLLTEQEWENFNKRQSLKKAHFDLFDGLKINPTPQINEILAQKGLQPLNQPTTLLEFLKRPHVDLDLLLQFPDFQEQAAYWVNEEPLESLVNDLKYEGYEKREQIDLSKKERVERMTIPEAFIYRGIGGLSNEVTEKLTKIKPTTLGQASRIPGITPAALSILSIYIKKYQSQHIETS